MKKNIMLSVSVSVIKKEVRIMRIIGIFSMLVLAAAVFVTPTFAAPFNAENNPQIVANYDSGDHGIVGEPYLHTGADVVMTTGKNGGIQQWFYGIGEDGKKEGDHSVWKVSKDGSCDSGWVLVEDPYPEWGDYLVPGADYCVHTNDFHVSK
jgi:hypothetical protein